MKVSQASTKKSSMPWNTRVIWSDTPKRDLHPLAAEIGEREEEAGEEDAERIQPAEEGDDDRREAIAGRDADAELPDRTGHLADAGKAGEAAGDQEGEQRSCAAG